MVRGSGSAWLVSLVGATRFGPGAFGVGCRGRKANEPWEAPLLVLGRCRQYRYKIGDNHGLYRRGRCSYPARPQAGPSFQTAPTFRLPRSKGNKQPNPNPAPVQFPQLVELLTQIGLQCGSHG